MLGWLEGHPSVSYDPTMQLLCDNKYLRMEYNRVQVQLRDLSIAAYETGKKIDLDAGDGIEENGMHLLDSMYYNA